MAGLREIKKRIRAVGSTQKLTSAMRLIATAKLRRSIEKGDMAKKYEASLMEALQRAQFPFQRVAQGEKEKIFEVLPEFVWKVQSDCPHAILVFGAEKGLCGAYNLLVIREALRQASLFESKEKRAGSHRPVLFIPLSAKSEDFFLKNRPDQTLVFPEIEKSRKGEGEKKGASEKERAEHVANRIFKGLENKEIGSVSLIGGDFVNTLIQKVKSVDLFPLFDVDVLDRCEIESSPEDLSADQDCIESKDSQGQETGKPFVEPSASDLILPVVRTLTALKIQRAFIESETCEQASRMTMMDSSSRNAQKLIEELTLQYNRTRQASITTELIEIVAGTNAMVQD